MLTLGARGAGSSVCSPLDIAALALHTEGVSKRTAPRQEHTMITPTYTTAGQLNVGDHIDLPNYRSGEVIVVKIQTVYDRGPFAGQDMGDKLIIHGDEGQKEMLRRDQRITRYVDVAE